MNIAEKILRAKDDYDAVYEAGKKAVGEVLKFTDVSSNTYRSTVPNGVEPFARVNKIGGMTYKSKNLFEYPYADTTFTSRGITFTDNGDGSITLNGTNDGTGNSAFYIYNSTKRITLSAGEYIASAYHHDGSRLSAIHFIAYDGSTWISFGDRPLSIDKDTPFTMYIQIPNGNTTVFDNVTVYPMLNEGSTRLPYESYFAGLRSAKVDELKSEGANLIPLPYYHASGLNRQGITFTYDESGTVTLDGISTGYSEMLLFANKQLKAGTYVLRAFGADGSLCSVLSKYKNDSWIRNIATDDTGNGVTVTITEEDAKNCVFNLNIYVAKMNANFTNRQIKPMLVYGSTIPSEYKPYVGTLDTLAIPEAVQNLADYGEGFSVECENSINITNNKSIYNRMCKRFVFTGDEALYKYGNYANTIRFIGDWFDDGLEESVAHHLLVCSHFRNGQLEPNCVNVSRGSRRGGFWIEPSFFTTESTEAEYEATFKAWLKEQYDSGNPVTVVYALATPIETDISAYLTDEYIEVEGGGTITAVNEYECDALTNISYLIDTQGG